MRFLSRFVDSNDREIRRIQPLVDEINELEAEIAALSDEAIRERFALIREEIHEAAVPGEPTDEERTHPDLERRRELTKARHKREQAAVQAALDEVLPDVFAMAREAMKRTLGMRHFDVQLMGGMVLHQGKISEMKTGEGKTLVATLAVYLNALAGTGVHVVTVNDYLAKRALGRLAHGGEGRHQQIVKLDAVGQLLAESRGARSQLRVREALQLRLERIDGLDIGPIGLELAIVRRSEDLGRNRADRQHAKGSSHPCAMHWEPSGRANPLTLASATAVP